MTTPRPPLAVLVKGWPRLSETFIAQELVALEAAGHEFEIWSLRHPTDVKRHPLHDKLQAKVFYLPEYLHEEPERVRAGRAAAQKLPGYAEAWRIWRADLRRRLGIKPQTWSDDWQLLGDLLAAALEDRR